LEKMSARIRTSIRFDRYGVALAVLPSAALLFNFLNYHSYPYFSFDTLLVMTALLALPIVSCGLAALWHPAGYLVPALSIVVFLDTLLPFMPKTGLHPRSKLEAYAGIALVLAIVLSFGGVKLRQVLVLVFGVIVVSTAASNFVTGNSQPILQYDPQAGSSDKASLPPYIHLVLDSHIGANGLPPEPRESAAVRDTIEHFFERYGFRFFPAAFSHYYWTTHSLTNLVDYAESDIVIRQQIVANNQLFESLKAKGYRLHVYDTDVLKFCQSERVRVEFCYTYSPTSLAGLTQVDMKRTRKALLIAGHWLSSMYIVRISRNILDNVIERVSGRSVTGLPLLGRHARYDTSAGVNSVVAFERLKQDILHNPTGVAFFAHLMIPHTPFIYEANCDLTADPGRWSSDTDEPRLIVSDEARAAGYVRYLSQVRCIYRLLDRWMIELRQAGILDRATIVIHGDHGSRLSTRPFLEGEDNPHWRRMLVDSFSTLFAVHSPQLAPGKEAVQKPINRLVRELVEAPERLALPEPDAYFLMLNSRGPNAALRLHRYPIDSNLFTSAAER
jgi:hypothetical protein